ncbi:MAG TPA: hypothetical protein VKY19_26635 [Ktedonosporobacter sp.]|jgi:hypothetical protein|nr:hypothetical protein [Ktedonosporobacter sp.]
MGKNVRFKYSYSTRGHDTLYGIDPQFYHELPNHDVEFYDSGTGRAGIPRPGVEQVITVVGSALLSSSVVATAIKAWLDSRKRKITLSLDGSKKTLVYEGPNIKEDAATIQKMIDKLAKESGNDAIRITVECLPEGRRGT